MGDNKLRIHLAETEDRFSKQPMWAWELRSDAGMERSGFAETYEVAWHAAQAVRKELLNRGREQQPKSLGQVLFEAKYSDNDYGREWHKIEQFHDLYERAAAAVVAEHEKRKQFSKPHPSWSMKFRHKQQASYEHEPEAAD